MRHRPYRQEPSKASSSPRLWQEWALANEPKRLRHSYQDPITGSSQLLTTQAHPTAYRTGHSQQAPACSGQRGLVSPEPLVGPSSRCALPDKHVRAELQDVPPARMVNREATRLRRLSAIHTGLACAAGRRAMDHHACAPHTAHRLFSAVCTSVWMCCARRNGHIDLCMRRPPQRPGVCPVAAHRYRAHCRTSATPVAT